MKTNDVIKTAIGDLLILGRTTINGVFVYRVRNLKNQDEFDVSEFTIAYWVKRV